MLRNTKDEIVETRSWSSGVEIIAHVNWSHIARVRCALGFAGDELSRGQFGRLTPCPPLTLHGGKSWTGATVRAA
jgi:hypothetical protein